jgi:hypothetical protein
VLPLNHQALFIGEPLLPQHYYPQGATAAQLLICRMQGSMTPRGGVCHWYMACLPHTVLARKHSRIQVSTRLNEQKPSVRL